MNTIHTQEILRRAVQQALRTVKYPGFSRDIVSFGVVREIASGDGQIRVYLEVRSAKPEVAFQIQADVEKTLWALPELKGIQVQIEVADQMKPAAPASNGDGRSLNRLQEEVQSEGGVRSPDPSITAANRPDFAPDIGYGEDGPTSLDGPMGDRTSPKWQGPIPVFQWEIDPSRPELQEYGEAEAEREGWIFRMWWQVHPAGLTFVSISAIAEDDEQRPMARHHPIGRNVAVNLVYDLQRKGIVAIYGTALDFRPFVEVFVECFLTKKARSKADQPSPPAQSEIADLRSDLERGQPASALQNQKMEIQS